MKGRNPASTQMSKSRGGKGGYIRKGTSVRAGRRGVKMRGLGKKR